MRNFKLLSLVLAVVLCAVAFVGCGETSYTANNTEYVIGVSGPLTGAAAVYGVAVQNSAQMAVDEINAAGGLNGTMFKFVATDDMHDATKVATNYSSMLEGGMQVSLGTVTTAPGLEYKNLSKDDNVFFLTPSASGDDIPGGGNGFQRDAGPAGIDPGADRSHGRGNPPGGGTAGSCGPGAQPCGAAQRNGH